MSLHVVDPGLATLIVDSGRPGWRSRGVPVDGAADRSSFAIGNALVGNSPAAAALEICLAGPTLRAGCDLACVIYGTPFAMSANGGPAETPLTAGKTFTLLRGEELRVRDAPVGMRAYLCVRGGFQEKKVLGSRSALEPLRAGQELSCSPGAIRSRFVRLAPTWEPAAAPLRVLPGPQAGWFVVEDLYREEYRVSGASNRMGLRLEGKPLRGLTDHPAAAKTESELVSEPVCPGAIQVTRDGQCIILGMDGQTVGGYPKIAHVISADLDRIGQLRPRQVVHFTPVSLEEAEARYRQRQAELHEWSQRLLAGSLW